MSPQPATPDTALEVPSTPGTPLRTDATAAAPAVLQERSIDAPDRSKIVAIAELCTKNYAGPYFEQVYGVPMTSVRFLDSVRGFVATILTQAPCERVILLLHSAGGTLTLGKSDETVTLDDLAGKLHRVWGNIGRVSFDGCTLGTQPSAMFASAEAMGIGAVAAWTHTHVVGLIYQSLVSRTARRPRSTIRSRSRMFRRGGWCASRAVHRRRRRQATPPSGDAPLLTRWVAHTRLPKVPR